MSKISKAMQEDLAGQQVERAARDAEHARKLKKQYGLKDVRTESFRVVEDTAVESVLVAPLVSVVRTTVVRTPQGEAGTQTVSESVRYNAELPDPNFGNFVLMPPELLEKIRLTGWFVNSKDIELVYRKPFTHVVAGLPYELVRLRHYDHSAYDAQGLQLPVGMHFCYMDGGVDNQHFYLTRMLAHLQSRPDVTLGADRWQKDKFIQDIPSYNCDGARNQYIDFVWHPTVEDFRAFRAMVPERCDRFDRYRIALTFLGADAHRRPEPKEDED